MSADDLTRLASSILRVRRFRTSCLPGELFGGEQGWDLLLVLFIADAEGRRLTGKGAIEEAGGSAEPGRRWIEHLTGTGLIVGDGDGRLSDPLTLTPRGLHALEHWLQEARLLLV